MRLKTVFILGGSLIATFLITKSVSAVHESIVLAADKARADIRSSRALERIAAALERKK